MLRHATLAAVSVVILLTALVGTSCRKKSDPDTHGFPGPKPLWALPSVSVLEGGILVATLTLTEVPDDPHTVELESTDTTRATVPATVTFPVGVTTRMVTITTIADADNTASVVTIRAVNFDNVTSLLPVTLVEDDGVSGPGLGPVAAGANRVLLCGPGADGVWSTADDVLRVVTAVGTGAPVFTDVIVGAIAPGPHALPVLTGVSDTAVVLTNGPDLLLGTGDDLMVEVGGITGTPAVTASIGVGRMESSSRCRPVMVGIRAVIATRGADLLTNADDTLLVVDGIGTGTLSTSSIPMGGVAFEDPSQPVVFDASTLVIHTAGADDIVGTADDLIRLVTGIGAVPLVGSFGTGVLPAGPIGIPVVVSATAVVWVDAGFDTILGTIDDELSGLQGLPGAPALAGGVVVGPVADDASGRLAATGGDAVLIPTRGADLASGTPDDEIALMTSLSGVYAGPTALAAASPPAGTAAQIAVLSSSVAVRSGMGADGTPGTADDLLVLLTALTGVPATGTIATGAIAAAAPLASSTTSAVAVGEGPDLTPGTADDRILEVTGIGTAPLLEFTQPGPVLLAGPPVLVPTAGDPVLTARTAGPDAAAGTADDRLSVSPIP
ncbi:MAG: hypothetical protein HUU15_12130 [Candidatus Brocadiae bacterium]|nr:hypothetical protein [Candidatus Brocadiia bacterium]